jgi:hypothetical protein
MPMPARARLVISLVAALALASCYDSELARKETFPVTGQVLVDGKPAANIQVTMHDVNGIDQEQPTFSSAFTDEQGRFALSTYEQGDGVPAGEYVVTFYWGELNLVSMQFGGPDKLKNKYNDKSNSPFRIKVEKGKPADMGQLELTTR